MTARVKASSARLIGRSGALLLLGVARFVPRATVVRSPKVDADFVHERNKSHYAKNKFHWQSNQQKDQEIHSGVLLRATVGLADAVLSNASEVRTTLDSTRVWKPELPARRPTLTASRC